MFAVTVRNENINHGPEPGNQPSVRLILWERLEQTQSVILISSNLKCVFTFIFFHISALFSFSTYLHFNYFNNGSQL